VLNLLSYASPPRAAVRDGRGRLAPGVSVRKPLFLM
jgi:hypothetical protein